MEIVKKIKDKNQKIKKIFLNLILKGSKYHLGGSLSSLEIMVTLIYGNFIKIDKKGIKNFILSKGHALGILHSIMIEKKLLNKNKLIYEKKIGNIGGQLDIINPIKGFFEWNTGSLGHSIGIAAGMALASKKKIVTLIGDAEVDEGSIWESLFLICDKKIKNVVIIIDRNNLSASSIINKKKKNLDIKLLSSLNLDIVDLNGHDIDKLFRKFKSIFKKNNSTLVIANTIKGKGIKEIENNPKFSHQLPSYEILKKYS